MTDGTSQGLFIVVAIVIFGIFVLLAYILFEDTLSPAMASMFTNATEQARGRLLQQKEIVNITNFTGMQENLSRFEGVNGAWHTIDSDDLYRVGTDLQHTFRWDYRTTSNGEIRIHLTDEESESLRVGDKVIVDVTCRASTKYNHGDIHFRLGGGASSNVQTILLSTHEWFDYTIELEITETTLEQTYIVVTPEKDNMVTWIGKMNVTIDYKK